MADTAKLAASDATAPERHARDSLEGPLKAEAEQHGLPAPQPKLLRRLTHAQKELETGADPQGWISEYMTAQALWGSQLLKDLIKGSTEHDQMERLNPSVINSCEALSFIKTAKGGLGVTMAHGYGFVIKKLDQDNYGNSKWSQPLFFAVSQAGVGLAAGYQRCQSVIALLSQGSVDVFKNGTTSMGTDLGLFSTDGALMGMSGGAAMGSSQHLGMTVANTKSAFCYSKVDGLFLELSLHGSAITHDKESNTALYGTNYDADAILSGSGQYLSEMLPLLRTINLIGKGAVTFTRNSVA